MRIVLGLTDRGAMDRRCSCIVSGKLQKVELIRENVRSVIICLRKKLKNKFVKRHKTRHRVEILRGRRDLDINVEERSKRKDLEL